MNEFEPDLSTNGLQFLQPFGVTASLQRLRLHNDNLKSIIPSSTVLDLSKGLCENYTLNNVELAGCSGLGGEAAAPPLSQALVTNRRIKHLGLSRCRLGNTGISILAEALKINQTLTSLDISQNEAKDGAAGVLAEMLVMNNSITSVHMEHNKFHTDGYAALGLALCSNTKLKHLNAAWGKPKASGIHGFYKALPLNTTLRSLNLSMCELGQDALFLLFRSLFVNVGLETINVSMNNLGHSIVVLGEALCVNRTLREINMERCEIKSGEHFNTFCRSVQRSVSSGNFGIVALNLAKNALGNDSVRAMCEALCGASGLRYLDLGSTGIMKACGPCIQSVMKCVETCPHFHTLHLDENDLSDPGAIVAMEPGLQSKDFCLLSLNLAGCKIQAPEMSRVFAALTKTNTLQSLNVARNTIDDKTYSRFLMCLKCQVNLMALDVSDTGAALGDPSNPTTCIQNVIRLYDAFVSNNNLGYIAMKGSCVAPVLPYNAVLTRAQSEAWNRKTLDGVPITSVKDLEPLPEINNPFTSVTAPPLCCAPLNFSIESSRSYCPTEGFSSINISLGSHYKNPYNDVWIAFLEYMGRPLRGWDMFSPSKASPVTIPPPPTSKHRIPATAATTLTTIPTSEDELRTLFNRIDVNGNGHLDENEMKGLIKAFDSYGVVVSERQLGWLMKEYAVNGIVNFDAFCVMVLKLARR
eukprot:PhF_6_TR11664/c0_g1_i1/m.18845